MKLALIGSLFAFMLSQGEASAGTLDVYAYPPTSPLDWSTPRSTLKSFLKNYLAGMVGENFTVKGRDDFNEEFTLDSNYRSSMGHTIGHISCTLSSGQRYERWSSFSGQDFREVDREIVFKKKLGLGSLFYDFEDGHIISGQENIMRLTYLKGRYVRDAKGRRVREKPRFIRMKIDRYQCDDLKEMVDFFESFHFSPKTELSELRKRDSKNVLYFTNNMDPYESYKNRLVESSAKVGGGCAPYGVAMIKLVGFYPRELDARLKLNIPVSHKIIGNDNGHKVSMASIIFGENGSSWTFPGYKNRFFNQYDPKLIWDLIGEVRACLGSADYRGEECTESAREFMSQYDFKARLAPTQKFSHEARAYQWVDEGDRRRREKVTVKTISEATGIELIR